MRSFHDDEAEDDEESLGGDKGEAVVVVVEASIEKRRTKCERQYGTPSWQANSAAANETPH